MEAEVLAVQELLKVADNLCCNEMATVAKVLAATALDEMALVAKSSAAMALDEMASVAKALAATVLAGQELVKEANERCHHKVQPLAKGGDNCRCHASATPAKMLVVHLLCCQHEAATHNKLLVAWALVNKSPL